MFLLKLQRLNQSNWNYTYIQFKHILNYYGIHPKYSYVKFKNSVITAGLIDKVQSFLNGENIDLLLPAQMCYFILHSTNFAGLEKLYV